VKVLSWLRRHPAVRYLSLAVSIAAVILAVSIVSTMAVDLGPALRQTAETQASQYLDRPVTIGGLHVRLLGGVVGGRVEVDDLEIAGIHPGDRPFFTAKRITVALDWRTLVHREIMISGVELENWAMLVEQWDGEHNFPHFPRSSGGRRPVTTTLRWLRASRGQFSYEDHQAPWSVVARNIDITISNLPQYHGTATFNGGTVTIQQFEPMWANFKSEFIIDGSHIRLSRIDLDTDGATSVVVGDVDLAHWPEQTYQVKSQVNFPRMRELFFADESFDLTGEGDFSGLFHLFKGGHDLSGNFTSRALGVKAGSRTYPFQGLYGRLQWNSDGFHVWDAGADFFGGSTTLTYAIEHQNEDEPSLSRFHGTYQGINLASFSDFQELPGLRFAGAATGQFDVDWPIGQFSERTGGGTLSVAAPPGVPMMTASGAGAGSDDRRRKAHAWGPFLPVPLAAHLPVAGDIAFRFGPAGLEIGPSVFQTGQTHVSFEGATSWGPDTRITFHATSGDWQESDEVLAGILTDFGAKTGPVAFGGRGAFRGTMTGEFNRPRVEGDFTGEDLRAFDTWWGDGSAHVVVENSYVTVENGIVRSGDSVIRTDGLFSLGYPRQDGGDEIDARFRVTRRDLDSLRHAFEIDAYPITGYLSGEFHLTGEYERPIGFGSLEIDDGTAWGEPFRRAEASLRFDGTGVRLDGATIEKSSGSVTGAAFIGWDGSYSFNAVGRRIPLDQLTLLSYPAAPLTGIGNFTASGTGTFDSPSYDVRFEVADLFIGEEGIGQVVGTLLLRDREVSGEVEAASPRVAITGTGRVALTPQLDAEMTFRFHDSSLDPYVRLFVPQLSPYTTAVATGGVRITGELADIDHLLVDATVDTLNMRLFDYELHNAEPIRLALDRNRVEVQDLQLAGVDTRLRVSGQVGLADGQIALRAAGDANLGILQAFFDNVRGSGRAELTAAIDGPIKKPVFSGSATVSDGRIRHFALPAALDAINGTVYFDERGIRLDDVSATIGGGQIQFGGRVGFDGYVPSDLNVTVRGEGVRLRYPEGVRSDIDGDLVVRGPTTAPTLSGTITVQSAEWTRTLETPGSIFALVARRNESGGAPIEPVPSPLAPLRYDLRILVPSTMRVNNNLVRLVASADLTLSGTYEHPVLFGRADIDRGELTFEGRRYRVTHGSIDFTNPTRIEPFFDVEAETNVRVPGQTYLVTVGAVGTQSQLQLPLRSDPPLPEAEVLALLLSDSRRGQAQGPGDVELRALQNPNQAETDILATRATQALTGSISAEVGKVVEQTFGVDTFQLTPSFTDPYTQTSRLNPTARVTIGKRISDRVYLTFSRSLGLASTINDQIILLEYDQNDRLSWILSRNEDQQTFALEFRVRHTF
jgi:hypothetical protein